MILFYFQFYILAQSVTDVTGIHIITLSSTKSYPGPLLLKMMDFPGVTLAQLVKASVGQADVQGFEPHLGHNWLSYGVFLVKSRHFGLPLAQTTMATLAISLSGWLGRYTNVEYLQSLYLKRRGQLVFQV